MFKEVFEICDNVCETKTSRGGGKRRWRQENGESTCSKTELVRGVFNVHTERRGWVVQREHAECIHLSVPVAELNKSQEKGKGLPRLLSICKKQLPRSLSWSLFRGQGKQDREGVRRREDRQRDKREEEEEVPKSRTPSTYMGCVLSTDWCGEEEVQPVPVVRSSSLKRRSLERSESGRMRLTKVSVHLVLIACKC